MIDSQWLLFFFVFFFSFVVGFFKILHGQNNSSFFSTLLLILSFVFLVPFAVCHTHTHTHHATESVLLSSISLPSGKRPWAFLLLFSVSFLTINADYFWHVTLLNAETSLRVSFEISIKNCKGFHFVVGYHFFFCLTFSYEKSLVCGKKNIFCTWSVLLFILSSEYIMVLLKVV